VFLTRARQHTLPRRGKRRYRVLRHASGDEVGSRDEKETTGGLLRVRRYRRSLHDLITATLVVAAATAVRRK